MSLKDILKGWLLLTCCTTSFFFAAILLQEQGSFEQQSQVQSTAGVLELCESNCWPTCTTEKAFHPSLLLHPQYTTYSSIPALLEGAGLAQQSSKPGHGSACTLFRGEVLLQGLNCCSLLETQQLVPPRPVRVAEAKWTGPSQGLCVAGSTPTLLWQPWQRQGGAAAQPTPAPFSVSAAARKFSSISSVTPLQAAAAGAPLPPLCLPNLPNFPCRPCAPSPPHTPWLQFSPVPPSLGAQNKVRDPDMTSPAPSRGDKLLAPLQMQLNFWRLLGFFLICSEHTAPVPRTPQGWCPFGQGCCSSCPFPHLGSLGSRCRPWWCCFLSHSTRCYGGQVLQLVKIPPGWACDTSAPLVIPGDTVQCLQGTW